MDESIPDRLAQLKQQMAEAVERSVLRHPEYGEQKLRAELAPFIAKLDEAAKEYSALLEARRPKKKIAIPIIRLPTAPPPLPEAEGPKTRQEFIAVFQLNAAVVDAAIDRLLGRKAPPVPTAPIPQFSDWANESAAAGVAASDSGAAPVRGPEAAPADWDSWMAKTGAAPPANAPTPNLSPKTAPAPGSPVEGVWSWANDSGDPAAAANDAAVESDAETKKRLQEWLERRQKSGG